jgi:hypothetical protein
MKTLILLLAAPLLAGWMSSYNPELASPAKDQKQYETDRQACIADAHKRQVTAIDSNTGRLIGFGAFGLLGGAAAEATADKDDDFVKSPRTMVDECMAKRGYDVVKVSHL